MSRRINYSINKEETKIGKRNMEPANDIEIGGMGIRPMHAVVTKEEGRFYIQHLGPNNEDSDVYLNGESLSEKA